MEQSNMFKCKWQNFELSSFWLTFRNEKFPSKMISHSFESLTIEQITIV